MKQFAAQAKTGQAGLLLLLILWVGAVPVRAAPGEVAEAEIEHLLTFITASSCRFERNSKQYSGAEAVKHIKRKYAHFKDRIDTAEAFITYSATASTVSGRPYMVFCGSDPVISSADWLHTELKAYRTGPGRELARTVDREGD